MVGRPRSAACDKAILDAAIIEYAAGGLDGFSVDAVAVRAGVSKATIYRRYPTKVDLVIAAAQSLCEEHYPRADTGSLRTDLLATLHSLRTVLIDPVFGAAKWRLVADAMGNEQLAHAHRQLVAGRRETTLAMLQRAIDRGELRAGIDLEFAADEIGAPVFYRYLLMHETVDDAYIAHLVDAFVEHYGVQVSVTTT